MAITTATACGPTFLPPDPRELARRAAERVARERRDHARFMAQFPARFRESTLKLEQIRDPTAPA